MFVFNNENKFSYLKAKSLLKTFNNNSKEQHFLIHDTISVSLIIKTIYILFYNIFRYKKLTKLIDEEIKFQENSKKNFWLLMKKDFAKSFYGKQSIFNLLNILILKNPYQIYLNKVRFLHT